ncbi:MAG TPA: HypC/HybG/HupF family hydrogenase formation chaperone [Bryobacteraceae bacterium]|nr:HypC/HybG/HupF family hydrogenase formation chaperone [Bryobacteraceae bacterium]
MCLAIPGRITEITEDAEPALRRGKIDFAGVKKEISLAFTPDAVIGDYVLVHAGFALNTVDEGEARKIFEHLELMAQLEEAAGDTP